MRAGRMASSIRLRPRARSARTCPATLPDGAGGLGLQASRARLPRRSVRLLGSRFKNQKDCTGALYYFFIVPPGLAASPFFSAEPAVPAPWVLASFADGIELVELPLAPVVLEEPPVDGVCCVVSLLGLIAAGPPDVRTSSSGRAGAGLRHCKRTGESKSGRQ